MSPNESRSLYVAGAGIDNFRPLSPWEGGLSDEPPRLEALATISAGTRQPGKDGHAGLPSVSRDGTIYLHDRTGRAPGLRQALEATGNKRLTIAFPLDDVNAFIQQRFVRYSATHLLAYGDEERITLIQPSGHFTYTVDSEGYAEAAIECKVAFSVYFALASWDEHNQPQVNFPDGLGFYRLRTTSAHSLRSILAGLRTVAQFTRSRIAGVPFELSLDYRDVADGSGTKRTIPVWVIVPKEPTGLVLSSRTFAAVMGAGLEQGRMLQLPAPSQETIDQELADQEEIATEGNGPGADGVAEPGDDDIALMAAGGRCNPRDYERAWFAAAKDGSSIFFATVNARQAFLRTYTLGKTGSLREYLAGATIQEADALLAAWRATVLQPVPHEVPPHEEDEEIGTDTQLAEGDAAVATVTPNPPQVGGTGRPSEAMWNRLASLVEEASNLGVTQASITEQLGPFPTRGQTTVQQLADYGLLLRAFCARHQGAGRAGKTGEN